MQNSLVISPTVTSECRGAPIPNSQFPIPKCYNNNIALKDKNSVLKLYGPGRSRASIVKWYLEEIAVPYELVMLDIFKPTSIVSAILTLVSRLFLVC